jgi:hypothetical protein
MLSNRSLDASLAILMRVLRFEASQRQRPGWSDRPPGRLDRPRWPHLLVESSASVLWINRVTQWFSGEPLQTSRTLLCCPAACVWIDFGSIICVCSFSSDWSDLILAGLSDTAGFTQTGPGRNLGLISISWNQTRP